MKAATLPGSNNYEMQTNVSDLPAGIYMLLLSNEQGVIGQEKIIVE